MAKPRVTAIHRGVVLRSPAAAHRHNYGATAKRQVSLREGPVLSPPNGHVATSLGVRVAKLAGTIVAPGPNRTVGLQRQAVISACRNGHRVGKAHLHRHVAVPALVAPIAEFAGVQRSIPPDFRYADYGFRVAVDVNPRD